MPGTIPPSAYADTSLYTREALVPSNAAGAMKDCYPNFVTLESAGADRGVLAGANGENPSVSGLGR